MRKPLVLAALAGRIIAPRFEHGTRILSCAAGSSPATNTYERLEKRMRVLEGMARGENAIREGLTLSHSLAKRRIKRWLD